MRIVDARLEPVSWPIRSSGAARGRTERSAILLELTLDDGSVAYGEAAPLPEYDFDTLDRAAAALAAFTLRAPFELAPTFAAVAALAVDTPSPSARFAIETALLAAAASTARTAIASLLVPAPAWALTCSAVVDTPEEAVAAAKHTEHLKIKVGPDGDLAKIKAIAMCGHRLRLRIDANRTWPLELVGERMRALSRIGPARVTFVEEPCADHAVLALDPQVGFALDESLGPLDDVAITALVARPSVAALVLKPTLLGGFTRCLELARIATAAHKSVIITHALEGPVGTAACAELALALHNQGAGLALHPGLDGWAVLPAQLGDLRLRRTGPTGLGLTPGALDAPWWPRLAARAGNATPVPVTTTGKHLVEARRDPIVPRLRPRGARVLLATPVPETIFAIHDALATGQPLALLHPRLPPAELDRQRTAVEQATLPPDAALVLFTSGSTAAARGVVLSATALLAAATASRSSLGLTHEDRWLLALPLAHAGGASIVVRSLLSGGQIALMQEAFEPGAVSVLLEDCTLASLVPTQLAALLADPEWRPSGKLRALLLGGAGAPATLLAEAARRDIPLVFSYGMTETLGQVAAQLVTRGRSPRTGTAPILPLPGVRLEAGTVDAPTRIRVHAPMLATCYLDGTSLAEADGGFTTADLGYVAADGGLHVLGRVDDVIITGGEKTQPLAVEAILAATPGVMAACVFAVPDARWGHLVAAAITTGPTFDLAVATAHWHVTLASHARPRELAIVSTLPLSPNGKIDRRAATTLPRVPVRYPGR